MNDAKQARILVADDDDAFRSLMVRVFEHRGYKCDCAEDADKAIHLLQTNTYDLLVSDIRMPGNDDLRLAKAVPTYAEGLPVIFLTGSPSIETATESIRLNVIAYLVKPAPLDKLLGIAAEGVARHRLFRAVRASRTRLQEWTEDVGRIEELLQSTKSGNAAPMDAFLSVTLQNMLTQLMDWRQILGESPASQQLAHGERNRTLLEGVQDAIGVLEKTKQSFKSKDLAELRKRLETLVRQGSPADEKAGAPPRDA